MADGQNTPPVDAGKSVDPPEPKVTTSVVRRDPVGDTQTPTPDHLPDAAEDKYRGPDWAGHPNFNCPLCEYATLDGARVMEAHVRHAHPLDLAKVDESGKLRSE